MKKKVITIDAITTKEASCTLPLHGNVHGHSHSHFAGDAYEGDPWEGDVVEGELVEGDLMGSFEGDLSTQEASAIAQGAPIAQVLAAKSGTQDTKSIARRKAEGTLVSNLSIPAVIPVNARIKQAATMRSLSGSLVAQNIKRHRTITPFQSIIASAVPVNGVATVTFDASLFPQTGETPAVFSVPMLFVTIAASVLNARAGALYTIRTIGLVAEYGATCDDKQWQVERIAATDKMSLRIIPFKRVKDDVKPMLAMIANDQWVANPLSFSVQIGGLASDETVQIVIPGLDSQEITEFMQHYGIKA